ncbi:hypothetical protein [Corynebacterium variabile]|uniref:hypothetical protein n=1 Tax=Corynebacterium variabile TaxID=1727 RepID=UPI0002EDC8BA|nr:hypothetical protein [Corynebacterium variabile]
MSQYWIAETSAPEKTDPSANTPFRSASQRREPGRIGRFFRSIARLWMHRSRPEGPAER